MACGPTAAEITAPPAIHGTALNTHPVGSPLQYAQLASPTAPITPRAAAEFWFSHGRKPDAGTAGPTSVAACGERPAGPILVGWAAGAGPCVVGASPVCPGGPGVLGQLPVLWLAACCWRIVSNAARSPGVAPPISTKPLIWRWTSGWATGRPNLAPRVARRGRRPWPPTDQPRGAPYASGTSEYPLCVRIRA